MEVDEFLNVLNSQYQTIKFTIEIEKDGKLPFLDTLIIRNKNKLEFDVYRKVTNTNRFIPADSNHPQQHKLASINSLVHRMISFPLNKERHEKELKTIKTIAKTNGYDESIVDNIARKMQNRQKIRDTTTLKSQKEQKDVKYIKLPHFSEYTRGLNTILNRYGYKVVFETSNNLKNALGNAKDKIEDNNKSGIYKINCGNCEKVYIGQTKRALNTRFKEHVAHFKYGRYEKSKVAEHMFETGHKITENNLKLLKSVKDNRKLDCWESIFIRKEKTNALNSDLGPIPGSKLFSIIQ